MRFCPLARVSVPCPESAPWCSWCGYVALRGKAPEPGERDSQPATARAESVSGSRPQRVCVDCRKDFAPASNRQIRCRPCGLMHDKAKNAGYQRNFRQRKAIGRQQERFA
jgi:hypothetical protein